ncbi:tetratricopeptide repeat protein [Luteibacter rhizovicinus]|uniref:tetratricopeptide repeat protein n=1 Tax=Luteibacter rhizovicinus TaxID=242606 RepID=UPI001FB4DA8E|nr:tetratricopeptide repeat protein [Luteibacter rhizovicinus]
MAVAVALAALAGCATAPERVARTPASAQPLDHLQVAILPPERDLTAQLLEGDFALAHNDLKAASAAYGRAAFLTDDPKVAARATELALAVHDIPAVGQALDRWKALGATPAQMASTRARLALDRGDTDDARQQLELLVSSGDPDAWREFGRIILSARDAAQAAQLLEQVATPQRLPNDAQAWLAMAELGEGLGRHDYAARTGQAAMARFHNAETYAWAAQQKFRAKDPAGARVLFAKAMQKDPKNARLRLAYATLLAQGGDEAGATKVLSTGAQDADTYALRTTLAARANDKAAMRRLYEEIQRRPDDEQADSAFTLGQLAEMLDKKEDALDWYADVPDDDAHAFDASVRSAVVLDGQGKKDEAHALVADLQTAYADQPDSLRKAFGLDAELYMREGSFNEAADAYSHALRVKADDPEMLYGRGLAYSEAGKIDLAVADFRRVLELKPGDVETSNALGYTLADSDRDLDEAQTLLQAARSARPNDPAIADSWGWLQYRQGRLDSAEQTLRGAWGARKDADVGVHLAEVLWKRGEHGEAKRVLDEVRKLDPKNATLRSTEQRLKP